MSVYMIRAGDTEFVKIGWSEDVEDRRNALQTSHWEVLQVIRLIEGSPRTERWLHRQFADRHVRREWYRFCDEMLTIKIPSNFLDAFHRHSPVIEAFGGTGRLAMAIGVEPSLASHWARRGIPAKHWYKVVRAVEGVLPGLTINDLEPTKPFKDRVLAAEEAA